MLLDTAGRTHIDEPLMAEMAEIRDAARPHEILLVADALTGQDAVNLAKNFNERVGVTGIVLTRMDGDGRGGAALSMRAVTGKPIKLLGVGEKMDALEDFHPRRLADRILGMGDIVTLVEKAAQTIDAEQAAKMAEKMRKGVFDLDDLSEQLAQIEKLGGMGGIMGMLPGVAKIKDQIAAAHLDDKVVKRQRAIISSMTPKERRNPDLLKASRKKRIAAGAGVGVELVNRLLKQHRQMADMMKSMGATAGKRGLMGKLGQMMGMGGGMADADAGADRARCRRSARRAGRRRPPGIPGAPPPGAFTCRRISRPRRRRRNCPASAAASTRSGGRKNDASPLPPAGEGRDPDLERNANANLKGKPNVSENPSLPRRRQEAAVLSHRRRRRAHAARRPLRREDRHLRSPEGQGRRRPRLVLDQEKAKAWLAKGAQPTDRVLRLLDGLGIAKREAHNNPVKAQAEEEGAGARRRGRRRRREGRRRRGRSRAGLIGDGVAGASRPARRLRRRAGRARRSARQVLHRRSESDRRLRRADRRERRARFALRIAAAAERTTCWSRASPASRRATPPRR